MAEKLSGEVKKKMPKKLTTGEFIEKALKIHGERYDYSEVSYTLSNVKIDIRCRLHGIFRQLPNNHLNGQHCPQCNGNIKLTTEEFVERAKVIHPSYDYSKTKYKTFHTNICISCPTHGDFYQAPSSHLKGFGCPVCACYRVSIPETEFMEYLNIRPENRQVYIARKTVDGYDPATKIIYEFLGDYWHGNPDKFSPDAINVFCKKSFGTLYRESMDRLAKLKTFGYTVKYIWEHDWNEFKRGATSFPFVRIFE